MVVEIMRVKKIEVANLVISQLARCIYLFGGFLIGKKDWRLGMIEPSSTPAVILLWVFDPEGNIYAISKKDGKKVGYRIPFAGGEEEIIEVLEGPFNTRSWSFGAFGSACDESEKYRISEKEVESILKSLREQGIDFEKYIA